MAVVLLHAIHYRPDPPVTWWLRPFYEVLMQGHLGVPLFFVISGFCIHLRWARRCAHSGGFVEVDFVNFWKRRLHRLYPPYLIALCLTMSMVVVAYLLGQRLPIVTLYPEPFAGWFGIDFVAHLFMLHGLHPLLDKAGGNGVYWTLAREEYFYMMYFALLSWRRWWGVSGSLLTVAAAGLSLPLLGPLVLPPWLQYPLTGYSSALVLWVQWCLGMAAVESYYGLVRLPRWCSSGWLVPLWGALGLYADHNAPLFAALLWGLTFFTLLNYCVERERAGSWPEANRLVNWLARVGIFSYSLYLFHNPVQGIVKWLLGPLAASPNTWVFLACFALRAVAGFCAGALFFAVVERRFLTYTPAAGVAATPPLAPAPGRPVEQN